MRSLATLAAFVRRDWTVARSYRIGFALELVTILFALTLFFYLGHLVDDSAVAGRSGLEGGYFAYALFGITITRIFQAAVNSFAGNLRQEQMTGTLEALMATPTSPAWLILCGAAYALLNATIQAVIMVVLAVPVFGVELETGPGEIAISAAAVAAALPLFAAAGVAVAAFTLAFKQTLTLTGLIVSGVTLMGGVYFPVDLLPAPLEQIGEALPFTWVLDVLRSALLSGEADLTSLTGVLLAAPIALALALAVFGVALNRARRDGSLAQY